MLIDIHAHTAEKRHPNITRSNGSSYPCPERLIEIMDESGIDRAAIMSGVSPECRYTIVTPEEVLGIHSMHPGRFIPFCNIDPRYLDNNAKTNFLPLLKAYKQLGCMGVGEYTPNICFDDPLNMNFFHHVQEAGLPITFHLAPHKGNSYGCIDDPGLPRLERALKTFPELTFLGHSMAFWVEISHDVNKDNRNVPAKGRVIPGRVVELMRRYPNLHGDLSAGSGFNAISRDPGFGYRFMEEFSDRLYFGTDICNRNQKIPILNHFRKIRDEHLVSKEAFEKITWRNAARLFGI